MSPKRIYIVGPSGSGKTTLGKFLCQKLNIPHVDLDQIAYPKQKIKPVEERLRLIAEVAQRPAWVTEGIYVDWTKKLLEKADLIIWLDLPLHKTLVRVIKRFIAHKIRGDEKFGIKNTSKFIFNLKKYYYPKKGEEHGTEEKQTTRHKTAVALKPYMEKVVHVRSASELEKFLGNLPS